MFSRHRAAAIFAEFFGTFLLTSAVLAMVTRSNFSFFAAIVAGATLALVALGVGKVSGAQINPAVTLGLWTIRKVETTTMIVFVGAQVLGAFLAGITAEYLLGSPLQSLVENNLDWRIMTAEMIGAFVLATGVAAAVSRGYEGGKQAATIGITLSLGVVVASLGGAGIINPAVAIGLNAVSTSYLVAPLIGSIVGFTVYGYLFAPLDKKTTAVPTEASVTTRSIAQKAVPEKKVVAKKPLKKASKK